MAKRTPLECTAENCGVNYPRCGIVYTYSHRGCRCDSCHAAKRASWQKYPQPKPEPSCFGPCSPDNCGDHFSKCGSTSTYGNRGCRCDECRAAQKVADRVKHIANRDARLAHGREYRLENLEQCRERSRDYAAHHRVEARERAAAWRKANPERHRENVRTVKSRRRMRVAATVVPFTPEQWAQKVHYWGGRCHLQIPGICVKEVAAMDHVKPLSRGGAHVLANLRPACKPCNSSKGNRWPYLVSSGPSAFTSLSPWGANRTPTAAMNA